MGEPRRVREGRAQTLRGKGGIGKSCNGVGCRRRVGKVDQTHLCMA